MPLSLDQWRRAFDAPSGHRPADVCEAVLECFFDDYLPNVQKPGALNRAFGAVGPSGGDPVYKKIAREKRDAAYFGLGKFMCRLGSDASEMADVVLKEQRKGRAAASAVSPIQQYLDVIFREGAKCELIVNPDTLRKIISAQAAENIEEPVALIKPARMPR